MTLSAAFNTDGMEIPSSDLRLSKEKKLLWSLLRLLSWDSRYSICNRLPLNLCRLKQPDLKHLFSLRLKISLTVPRLFAMLKFPNSLKRAMAQQSPCPSIPRIRSLAEWIPLKKA